MRVKLFAFLMGLTWAIATAPAMADGTKAVMYKNPQCGCCGHYAKYLRQNGFKVTIRNMRDVTPIKERYGIHDDLWSCHTSLIGGYVVEGHVPKEAIDRLLTEKPDIRGIALAEMPDGSPGMPGPKTEPFVIQTITDSDPTVYMTQ